MSADHLASVDELLDEALRNATDAEVRYAIRSAQQHLVAVSRETVKD